MTSPKKRSAIDVDVVRQLADVLCAAGLTEIEYEGDDWRVRLARTPGTAAAAAGPPPAHAVEAAAAGSDREIAVKSEAEAAAEHPGLLKSPMVGIVYVSPEPSAPAFVKPGDTVTAGDTVLLIEAMKVFNPIKAHRAGRIERIFVTGGTPVEYGEPLLLIV
ncbi:MAG: acetyl-CoA carboxylase biotin carboxyl carrier protein subunit [Rhodospirillales bacterium]